MEILTATLELSERELVLVRQSLDVIQIYGKDAPFLASLMYKVEQEIKEIYDLTQQAARQKEQALQELLESDKLKQQNTNSKGKA
jgi:hypothetical protein